MLVAIVRLDGLNHDGLTAIKLTLDLVRSGRWHVHGRPRMGSGSGRALGRGGCPRDERVGAVGGESAKSRRSRGWGRLRSPLRAVYSSSGRALGRTRAVSDAPARPTNRALCPHVDQAQRPPLGRRPFGSTMPRRHGGRGRAGIGRYSGRSRPSSARAHCQGIADVLLIAAPHVGAANIRSARRATPIARAATALRSSSASTAAVSATRPQYVNLSAEIAAVVVVAQFDRVGVGRAAMQGVPSRCRLLPFLPARVALQLLRQGSVGIAGPRIQRRFGRSSPSSRRALLPPLRPPLPSALPLPRRGRPAQQQRAPAAPGPAPRAKALALLPAPPRALRALPALPALRAAADVPPRHGGGKCGGGEGKGRRPAPAPRCGAAAAPLRSFLPPPRLFPQRKYKPYLFHTPQTPNML